MSDNVLSLLPRNERRLALRREEIARRSGDWGPWEILPFSELKFGHPRGWLRDVQRAHRNRVFSVLDRLLPGAVARHLAITSLSQIRPTWWEMQRIKDDIAGPNATAVEVYPPHDEIVDGADMYHLWVLPGSLPFSLRFSE